MNLQWRVIFIASVGLYKMYPSDDDPSKPPTVTQSYSLQIARSIRRWKIWKCEDNLYTYDAKSEESSRTKRIDILNLWHVIVTIIA
ncbi:hypothetical protein Glove_290g8 [Diversispora epigaea]|uniref:Uncharacterized protein n=1 Tax=Diversispora epigaea TaxID=1348612 RepID=A0A397I268_9GLOM|nr:hypothetical protein Glove_290g8 [Diversispora epigaea]